MWRAIGGVSPWPPACEVAIEGCFPDSGRPVMGIPGPGIQDRRGFVASLLRGDLDDCREVAAGFPEQDVAMDWIGAVWECCVIYVISGLASTRACSTWEDSGGHHSFFYELGEFECWEEGGCKNAAT